MNQFEKDGYKLVCRLNQLKENEGKRFIIDAIEIAVFKSFGEVYALSNICPHQHTSLIYEGLIEEECVICPVHGWMFNLKTGKTPAGSNGLESYDVKIINNHVYKSI